MGRAEVRASMALEKNPIEACNEVQKNFVLIYSIISDKLLIHDTRVISHIRERSC